MGYVVKLPKKGDRRDYRNYRGIVLLTMPAGKGSLQSHFKDTEDSAVVVKLRDDQAGFRKERSCTHQIAILRIIVHPSNGILRSTSTLWITKKLSTAWTESLFGSL